MTDTLVHRGPDAGDIWLDPEAGLALGHRRLSIIDLSPAGAQPMVSSCGRFVVSYNGEVYNADELRPELEAAGRRFRGHSDTEVIVEGAAVWGVEATVKRLIGMFAMALWDRRERTLYLVRDRVGIKPLYWAEFDGRLLFGSELKALRADRSWTPELDRDALLSFLRFGYVPAPDTIYRGVHKLPPGTILRVSAGSPPVLSPYWSLQDIACQGQSARFCRQRGRGRRCARRAAAGRGPAPHGGRRAARRLSVGRHRFIDGGRADAGAEHETRAHLFDRLSRGTSTTRARTPPPSRGISGPSIPSCTPNRAMRSMSSRSSPTCTTSRLPTPRSCRPISCPR